MSDRELKQVIDNTIQMCYLNQLEEMAKELIVLRTMYGDREALRVMMVHNEVIKMLNENGGMWV